MLQPIEPQGDPDSIELPASVRDNLAVVRSRVEAFHDCWNESAAEQFVAADYELVFRYLGWIRRRIPMAGNRFLEWGCGFSAVACMADGLGWESYAVESHPDLVRQAKKTISAWPANVRLLQANFLPEGADSLSPDPTLPSLGHRVEPAYHTWQLDLSDFAVVYAYPWPGEDTFHEDVFDHYADPGAVLLLFIGPNEMRLWQKRFPDRRHRHRP